MSNEATKERMNTYVRPSTRKMLRKMGEVLGHTSEGQSVDTAVSVSFVLLGEVLKGNRVFSRHRNDNGNASQAEPLAVFPELLAMQYLDDLLDDDREEEHPETSEPIGADRHPREQGTDKCLQRQEKQGVGHDRGG